jgi:hypothetical protein
MGWNRVWLFGVIGVLVGAMPATSALAKKRAKPSVDVSSETATPVAVATPPAAEEAVVSTPEPAPPMTMPAPASGSLLDGHIFIGEWGKQGEPANGTEQMTFGHGQLSAKEPAGFSAGAYTATAEGELIKFEAETLSKREGRLWWRGMVTQGQLSGVFTWFREGKNPIDYWVKGRSNAFAKTTPAIPTSTTE